MGLTPGADCSNAGLRKLRSVRTHTRQPLVASPIQLIASREAATAASETENLTIEPIMLPDGVCRGRFGWGQYPVQER
jgi:hypothetical protein